MRKLEAEARRLAARRAERRIPSDLSSKWVVPAPALEDQLSTRLSRFRNEVIPWLDSSRPLSGQRILEVGVGAGASTIALAEQGASVVGIDVDGAQLALADDALRSCGLKAELHVRNAVDLATVGDDPEQVIFWAVLEHMTIEERLLALSAAWDLLKPGGLLTLVETPNRLWPFDSHTSKLPYFSWLPGELAFRYSVHSPRSGFGDLYADEQPRGDQYMHFIRRGHGVSFHEFAVAFEIDHREIAVSSCMQLERRRSAPYRAIGWRLSAAGKTERLLRSYDKTTHRAWYQPFLYLTLVKT